MTARNRPLVLFGLIGIANTLVDISIYAALHAFGTSILAANITSTSAALLFSYGLNRKYTFRSERQNRQSLPLFIGVTLVGLWILQPLVIYGVLAILGTQPFLAIITGNIGSDPTVSAVIGKLVATAASMIWNYLLYKQLVFRRPAGSAHSQAK